MVTVKGPHRHAEHRCEVVELVETRITHQVAPLAITEPPSTFVDVQSQRRRSLRTRTGIGFGVGLLPRTCAPIAPIPTAAPITKVSTIQEFMIRS